MANENSFRIVIIALFLSQLVIGIYHRRRAAVAAGGEKISRREEGIVILALLRPIGLLGLLSICAYMLNPSWMLWSQLPLPAVLRWSGAPVVVAALAWFTWVLRHLGTNVTDTVAIRRQHTLVTSGPYRWVRHPLYIGIVPLFLGYSMLMANWFLTLIALPVLILLAVRTRIEERNLVGRFGDEYRAYMGRTGRFIPRLPLPRGKGSNSLNFG